MKVGEKILECRQSVQEMLIAVRFSETLKIKENPFVAYFAWL
jgi:hypothetical protein